MTTGLVARMDENTVAVKVFSAVSVGGCTGKGSTSLPWKDQVEVNLTSVDISNWRQMANRRNDWRVVVNRTIIT